MLPMGCLPALHPATCCSASFLACIWQQCPGNADSVLDGCRLAVILFYVGAGLLLAASGSRYSALHVHHLCAVPPLAACPSDRSLTAGMSRLPHQRHLPGMVTAAACTLFLSEVKTQAMKHSGHLITADACDGTGIWAGASLHGQSLTTRCNFALLSELSACVLSGKFTAEMLGCVACRSPQSRLRWGSEFSCKVK